MPIEIENPETVKDLKDIRSQLRELNIRKNKIESDAAEQENKALVGKCFKVQNCYSCPEGPGDYWWLYKRIDSIEGANIRAVLFETDKYGKTTIDPDYLCASIDRFSEISQEEFNKAWRDTMSVLSDL